MEHNIEIFFSHLRELNNVALQNMQNIIPFIYLFLFFGTNRKKNKNFHWNV